MSQAEMNCPACGQGMERVVEPDLQFERCPDCAGIFLDAGELNALITAIPGDVEYCSITPGSHADRFATRQCPRCPQQAMKKENLLQHGAIVFDRCEACHGWFLDRRELSRAQAALDEIRSGDAEHRGRHRDHLVTLVKVPVFVASAVGPLGMSAPTTIEWNRVDAFLERPLGAGLRVSPETWSGRLLNLLGAQDAATGDEEFDRAFRVRAEDPAAARAALHEEARRAFLDFLATPLATLGDEQRFEALDDRVVFCFRGGSGGDRAGLFEALAGIAAALDRRR